MTRTISYGSKMGFAMPHAVHNRLYSKVALAFIVIMLASCDECTNEVIQSVKSPTNKYIATVYIRDCGATTRFITQVNIRDVAKDFSGDDWNGVVFAADNRAPLSINWEDEGTLKINYDSSTVRILRANYSWRNVKVIRVSK